MTTGAGNEGEERRRQRNDSRAKQVILGPIAAGQPRGGRDSEPIMSAATGANPGRSDTVQSVGFNELRLQVGTRVQIVPARDGDETAQFTTVVGFVRDDYLILKQPPHGPGQPALREGELLRVRLFSGVHLYEFRCEVLRRFEPPVDYMHVSFPDDIRVTPVRMAPRVRAELPVEVTLADGTTHEGLLADLSARGAQLQMVAPDMLARAGEQVRIAFTVRVGVDEHDQRISVAGTAHPLRVSCPDSGSEQFQAYGLEFGALDAAASLALQNFILRRMIEDQDAVV